MENFISPLEFANNVNDQKQLQRDVLIRKGMDMENVPFVKYHEKISAISDWQRPEDRPVKPAMADNMILMLFGVGSKTLNDMAFIVATPAGQYTVDWGDGTVESYNSGVKAEHLYDYDSLYKPIDSIGYKMCWITVTSTEQIQLFNAREVHSIHGTPVSGRLYTRQIFEMYIQCPELTTLTWCTNNSGFQNGTYSLLEIISLDVNKLTTLHNFLVSCRNLRVIEKLYIDNVTTMNYFMYGCTAYNNNFPENAKFNMAISNFMMQCQSYNKKFPEGTTFEGISSAFMQACYAYNQPFEFTFRFKSNAASVNFLSNCYSYNHSVAVDLTDITSSSGLTTGNYNQKGLRLLNMGLTYTTISIANTNMDVPAILDLFSDLADRASTTAGTITITNCAGARRLTAADRLIATSKNWTIVG